MIIGRAALSDGAASEGGEHFLPAPKKLTVWRVEGATVLNEMES